MFSMLTSLREKHAIKLLLGCVTRLFFCICLRHIDQFMFCQMLYIIQYIEKDTIAESVTPLNKVFFFKF